MFVDITPENSVFGPTYGLPTTLAASPNISSNSSGTSDAAEPSSLERYLQSDERHEEIALSIPVAPEECHTGTAKSPSDEMCSELDTEPTLSGDSHPSTEAPIHRYVADLQLHEWRALILEQYGRPQSGIQTGSSNRDSQKIASSISLSDSPDTKNEGDDMALVLQMAKRVWYVPLIP